VPAIRIFRRWRKMRSARRWRAPMLRSLRSLRTPPTTHITAEQHCSAVPPLIITIKFSLPEAARPDSNAEKIYEPCRFPCFVHIRVFKRQESPEAARPDSNAEKNYEPCRFPCFVHIRVFKRQESPEAARLIQTPSCEAPCQYSRRSFLRRFFVQVHSAGTFPQLQGLHRKSRFSYSVP